MDIAPVSEGAEVAAGGKRLHKVLVIREDCKQDIRVIAEGGSSTDITLVIMPGCSADISLDLDFTGEGAGARIAGLYICAGDERVKVSTTLRHRMPGCTSDQLFTGIAGGESRIAFAGTIIVAPDAQKTEAYKQSRNLLLSRDAKVDTEPQLEIYADDVKCSHGATVGSLNPDEQFYMRSRGIPEKEARILQMISFIAPVLEGLDDPAPMAAEIEKALRSSF